MVRFRPLPPQAGHFKRINAMPSDLPFKSTGCATYPLPPQFGQSSGATPYPPQCCRHFPRPWLQLRDRSFCVTNHEQESAKG
jgi:hypothetical protein